MAPEYLESEYVQQYFVCVKWYYIKNVCAISDTMKSFEMRLFLQ